MLFLGDDWAEAHHDVELVDESGWLLARRRLPEGLAGITTLHELIAEHLDPMAEPDQVQVGIESDRGPWVQALLASGYVVFAINPMQVARYRERHSASGAKSDPADAHLLAEIVRLDRTHHRPIAGDTEIAEHVKVAARAHQTMIWSRVRQVNAAVVIAGVLPGSVGRVRNRSGEPRRAGCALRGAHAQTWAGGCPRPGSKRCSVRLVGNETCRPRQRRSAPR